MTNQKKPRRMARAAAGNVTALNDEQCGQAAAMPEKRVSKQRLILDLMRSDAGASLSQIVGVTGWLPQTGRAALTGLRKKGHAIEKSKVDGETRYSVKAGSAQ